jgi:hypothetical protein
MRREMLRGNRMRGSPEVGNDTPSTLTIYTYVHLLYLLKCSANKYIRLYSATRRDVAALDALALERLHLAEPVYRIVVGRRYGQTLWLFPVFTVICSQRDPLLWGEAELLGLEDIRLIS